MEIISKDSVLNDVIQPPIGTYGNDFFFKKIFVLFIHIKCTLTKGQPRIRKIN